MTKRLILLLIICIGLLSVKFDVNAGEKKAIEIVEDIQVGWNLGNTLDCYDDTYGLSVEYYETMLGNPKTTQTMIKKVREAGFNAIRVPVTYTNHIDRNGKIDASWLARVEEIVQYGLIENMYVIINLHHDTGYGNDRRVLADLDNIDIYCKYIETVWQQIAVHFKDYDNRLLFEGMNEAVDMSAQNPWYGNKNSWEAMNQLNQVFVKTVRATGGNNSYRNLIISTYGAQTTYGPVNDFRMPEDIVSGHLIVGVHTFVIKQDEISEFMKGIYNQFVLQGYPVLVTEFGTAYWHNVNLRTASAINVINYGNMYGIKCFWWDDGGDFKLLNRKSGNWYYPPIVEGMMQAITLAEAFS